MTDSQCSRLKRILTGQERCKRICLLGCLPERRRSVRREGKDTRDLSIFPDEVYFFQSGYLRIFMLASLVLCCPVHCFIHPERFQHNSEKEDEKRSQEEERVQSVSVINVTDLLVGRRRNHF